jgi:hypothetical protein
MKVTKVVKFFQEQIKCALHKFINLCKVAIVELRGCVQLISLSYDVFRR